MTRLLGYMLNARYVAGDALVIQPNQPYFAHGHGLFETLRSHEGKPCFLDPHVARMAKTADQLGLGAVPPRQEVRRQIEELLAAVGVPSARIKLHLLCKHDGTADFLITAEEVAPLRRELVPIAAGRAAPQFRGDQPLAGLKTMNYMLNRLAEDEARERGFAEAIFTLSDDTVTEGTRSTVFGVWDGVVGTTPLSVSILPGVTRSVILGLCRRERIPVREEAFRYCDLERADEVFLTGSVGGIRPLGRLENLELPPSPGLVTETLAEAYWCLHQSDPIELPDLGASGAEGA